MQNLVPVQKTKLTTGNDRILPVTEPLSFFNSGISHLPMKRKLSVTDFFKPRRSPRLAIKQEEVDPEFASMLAEDQAEEQPAEMSVKEFLASLPPSPPKKKRQLSFMESLALEPPNQDVHVDVTPVGAGKYTKCIEASDYIGRFRATAIVYTIHTAKNNWNPRNLILQEKWTNNHFIRYIIGQLEDTPPSKSNGFAKDLTHWQMYCQLFERCQSRKTIQYEMQLSGKSCFAGKFWLKRARGTSNENSVYCSKESWASKGNRVKGTEVFEWGTPVTMQGERTDKQILQADLESGMPMYEVAQANFKTWLHTYRACQEYAAMVIKEKSKKFRKVNVIVRWGDTETNKSKMAHEQGTMLGGFDKCIRTKSMLWFQQYLGKKCLIIEEFYGQDIKWQELLRLLDGQPETPISVKGGNSYACWTTVIITSNLHPKDWYNQYWGIPQASVQALMRRITKIIHHTRGVSREVVHWAKQETIIV